MEKKKKLAGDGVRPAGERSIFDQDGSVVGARRRFSRGEVK